MNSAHFAGCRPNRQSARAAVAVVAALLGTASVSKADVLLVDPSDLSAYAQIQPAVDDALPGDLIVIRPLADNAAHYDPFTVGGKTVAVIGWGTLGTIRATSVVVSDVPVGSIVVIRGLQFDAPSGETAITFNSGLGAVRMEDCIAVGGAGDILPPASAMYATDSQSVIVNTCHLTGGAAITGGPSTDGAAAVVAIDSRLSIRAGEYTGGAGANGADGAANPGGRGGAGIQTHGGWQFISDASVNGGAGGQAGCESQLLCTCGDLGNGGDAVVENDTVLITQSLSLLPGAPSESLCAVGFSGQPLAATGGVVDNLPGPHHAYSMSYPCQTPIPATFHFEGQDQEWIFISGSTTPFNKWMPKYDGELHLIDSNLIDFKFLRILDATGVHDTAHPIPPPPPGLTGIIGYTQAFFVNFSGGTHIHLGPSSTFLYIGYGP